MKHVHQIIYCSDRLPYIGWQAFQKSIMPTSIGIKLFHDTCWVLTYTHWVFDESLGIMWVPTEYHKEISYQKK